MLEGKPTVVLSYSGAYADAIAKPIADGLKPHGIRSVLVGEEGLPPEIDSNPNSKVEWFFRHADMAVFLATPDDRLVSGEIHTRQNIVDEHRLGQQLDHLSRRLLVFKSAEVKLPSNINPVYDRLPADDPDWVVSRIVEQARVWGVLPVAQTHEDFGSPTAGDASGPSAVTSGPDDTSATAQARLALTNRGGWIA